MTVIDCKQRMTHREFMAWIEFLKEEWNQPTRTDYYLMQIAQEIALSRPSRGRRYRGIKEFMMKFLPERTSTKKKVDPQEAARKAKAVWAMRMSATKKNGD